MLLWSLSQRFVLIWLVNGCCWSLVNCIWSFIISEMSPAIPEDVDWQSCGIFYGNCCYIRIILAYANFSSYPVQDINAVLELPILYISFILNVFDLLDSLRWSLEVQSLSCWAWLSLASLACLKAWTKVCSTNQQLPENSIVQISFAIFTVYLLCSLVGTFNPVLHIFGGSC